MTTHYVPLNNSIHIYLKVNNIVDYKVFENMHMLPLQVQEFMSAATSFPIIFTKNAQTGEFLPVAITSLKENSNKLMINGRWISRYLPIQVQLYPFGASYTDNKIIIGIDLNNSSVSEIGDNSLFTTDGDNTAYLNTQLELASLQANYQEMTRNFISILIQHDLLQPRTLTVNAQDGTKTNINGIYTVDEQKMHELEEVVMLDFAKRGFYSVIYAHLCSLSLIDLVMEK
ncbi:SapC [Shewanella baltica]|uniref:SapC family protein n=1 Tax=Shewanella baltica TaxID=62322 RepID=UPI000F71C655|nr:SapC family protein [Shewanella baltica]VEF25046.1 SapC [Shewanella baltica]